MSDDTPVSTLVLPVLLRPILSQVRLHSMQNDGNVWNNRIILLQLERRDVAASQTLRAALTKAEQAHPGLSYDIVMGILKKGDLNINLNESILRLQGNATESDRECAFRTTYRSSRVKFNLNNDVICFFQWSNIVWTVPKMPSKSWTKNRLRWNAS